MALKLDLINKRYGHLLVVKEIGRRKNSPLWECICDCGEICQYTTKELQNQHRIMCDKCKGIDITNKRFGKLTALYATDERKNGSVVWKCLCDCGNYMHVRLDQLKGGKVQSCGCSRKEVGERMTINLIGQRFGKLVVLEKTEQRKNNSPVWKCQCDCGNHTYVDGHSLRKGNTQSCGCLKSKGEFKVLQILQQLNIKYEYQKKFDDCIYHSHLVFDFYLPEYNTCIEYDGKQHSESIEYFGGDERLKQQQLRDQAKEQWCQNNHIRLMRISYTEYNTLTTEQIIELLRGKV